MNPSNPVPDRLFLTGYMGAGKSTVGRSLAAQLGFTFHDTDQILVGRFKKSVSKIFEQDGEEAFRNAEMDVLKSLIHRNKLVVSTGGGTLTSEEALGLVSPQGVLIYLHAPVEILYERAIFSRKDRPLLNVPDSEQVFQNRFHLREAYYLRAHLVVETLNKKPAQIATEIITTLALTPRPCAP